MLLVLSAWLTFQPVDSGLPRTGMWRHGFAVADINGDGTRDLIFTSPRKQAGPPIIYLNDGSGRFTRWKATFPPLGFDYGAVAAADFDGNGALDLAVGSHYRGVLVLLGDGNGNFAAVTDGFTYPSNFSSRALIATDWNGDGRLDVAALSDGPRPPATVKLGVTVFENFGAGWRATRSAVADDVFGDAIAAGDVDGDGLTDLVTASHNSRDQRLLRLGSDGALGRRAVDMPAAPSITRAVEMADFDGDGRDEIVIASTGGSPGITSLQVASFPAGSRPVRALWSGQTAIFALAAGDVDGDGAVDLVAALQDGRLLTFRGDGRGSLAREADIEPSSWRSGCDAYAVRIADLDGDRRGEVIATFASEGCPSGGGVEVLRAVAAPSGRRRAVRR